MIRRREERERAEAAPAAVKPQKRKPVAAKPIPSGPSPLEVVEADIQRQEAAVAELERKLAEDWGNVELLAAHRAARNELQALLARWETLFERSGAYGTCPQRGGVTLLRDTRAFCVRRLVSDPGTCQGRGVPRVCRLGSLSSAAGGQACGGSNVAMMASATTLSGFPDSWLARRSRLKASCSVRSSFCMRRPFARSIAFRAASASASESASSRSAVSSSWRARAVLIAGRRSVSRKGLTK